MAKNRRIVYVINPIAGTRSKHKLEAQIRDATEKAGFAYSVIQSTKTTHPLALQHLGEEFEATDMIACGGDGTVNLVAAAVKKTPMHLGIIPVGSGNGLARTAGISMQVPKALQTIFNGHTVAADAFCVNRQFACMLAGLGLDAAVAERFSHSSKRGLITYTSESLIQFFKAHPYSFEICLPDFKFFTDAFFISIANSNQFGNNVKIAPLASISDGLLDVVIVQKMPKASIPFALLRQLRGNNKLLELAELIGRKNILYFQTPAITIRNLHMAPLHIDGDPADTASELSFSMLPHCLRLLVPGSVRP
ncbi:MAG TPA: YegS/Rv2252/BmrU family lipid kinase [Phnomibacter sp.]|nr:YegS/Rv2252/BmrU family lipid kinase [Phnomibacter sp.]